MDRRLVAVALLLTAAAFALTGCDQIDAALNPQPEVITVEAMVARPDAPVDGTLPKSIPSDLPLWPGAKIKNAEADASSVAVSMSTETTYTNVVDGVTAGFQRAGWTVGEAGEEEGTVTLDVKSPSFEGIVTIVDQGPTVLIDYLLSASAS